MALPSMKVSFAVVLALYVIAIEGYSLRPHEVYQESLANGVDPQELYEAEDQLLRDSEDLIDNEMSEKRSLRYFPVVFFCTRKTAFCRNGGRGPTVKMDSNKKLPLCVCNCPPGYTLPQCGRKPKSNYS